MAEAKHESRRGKTDDRLSMLARYIYADASISERLIQGADPPSEILRVAELREKVEKIEEQVAEQK